jgi:hypothetical protein
MIVEVSENLELQVLSVGEARADGAAKTCCGRNGLIGRRPMNFCSYRATFPRQCYSRSKGGTVSHSLKGTKLTDADQPVDRWPNIPSLRIVRPIKRGHA